MVGSTCTVARSVARLTLASTTPSVRFRKRSMRLTHEAQVMPSIGSTISIVWGAKGVADRAVILPGSIPAAILTSMTKLGSRTDVVALMATAASPWGPVHVVASEAGVAGIERGWSADA